MSADEVKIKKPCGVYWDIGDSSVVGSTIKETVYLVRSVCQSNDLDDVSFQCVSSVNSISDYVGDLDTIKLITISDYSKTNACAKIVQLIEQFLYEFEPGSPIILIDPNCLFSTPLSNLSTRFDFEIYFIHLERTFDPSLEPIADNHFYLEGSSIYPTRSLSVSEIGTVAVKNYPPTVDTFNLIREIDHLYKSYGRIENSTICTSELAVVWVFFPSQLLAQNAANETQEIIFRGSPLSIVYLPQLPCPITDHPILASLISSSCNTSPEKTTVCLVDAGETDNHHPSSDQMPAIEIAPPTPNPQFIQVDSESSQSSNPTIVHELIEPDQYSLDVAEALSQLSSNNTTLNYFNENSVQTLNEASPLSMSSITVNDLPSDNQVSSESSTQAIHFLPSNGTTSSPNVSVQEPSNLTQQSLAPSPIQGPLDLNSTKNSDETCELREKPSAQNVASCVSPGSDCSFGVVAIHGRPTGVSETKFYRDMHGIFKKNGRLDDATVIHNEAVLLGFPDHDTAKRIAQEKNGMIYFGSTLTVTHVEKPTSNMIAIMKNKPIPCFSVLKETKAQPDPNLVVTMKSLKRSAPKSSVYVESVTDIGTITITNTPEKKEIREILSNLNGHYKRHGAIRDSAIWFKGAVWICFPDKKSAKLAAVKSHRMSFQGAKLTVNFIENPPQLLVETHFMRLLTPPSEPIITKAKPKSTKRAKRSNSQQSSLKGSMASSSLEFIPTSANPAASTKGGHQSSMKSKDSIKSGKMENGSGSGSKQKSKKGSSVSADAQSPPTNSKDTIGSKPVKKSNPSDGENESAISEKSQTQMDASSGHFGEAEVEKSDENIEIQSQGSKENCAEEGEDLEGSIAYCRSGGNVTVDRVTSLSDESYDSFDSLFTYMLSESIIYPIDGIVADSRFDYYQSSAYQTHQFSNLIKDALQPDRFVIFEGIEFKAYPNKFWVFFHLLRLTWPFGVLKIVHTKKDVYILFATCEGASSAIQLFNKSQDVTIDERPGDELFPPLERIKASIPVEVPSLVLTVIAMYSGTYSPWCFTENWDLFFLSIQVKDFVEAHEFAVAKGIVSNFGSLFIKPRDSHMIVAFADEKRVIHTMLFMKQSVIAKFDFCPNPPRPDDLFTLIRDYDLTGCCARLSQTALQQTFRLVQFKLPPPFIIIHESNDIEKRQLNNSKSNVEINFNVPTARTFETSPPIRARTDDSIQSDALTVNRIPSTTIPVLEARVNYYLRIEYNARHRWCYMYDILSKLWYYRIAKISYKQDHPSNPAETWIEVPAHINKDDLIKRLSAINYLKAPTIQLIVRPPFDILNNSISTGSSPWFFNHALQLRFAAVVPTDQNEQSKNNSLDTRAIKHLVEDEHAVFVKLLANVIWIAFPDSHSFLQGLLLINHEQRVRTGLMAHSASNIPDDLLSSIEIDDLVGVARDLAIANTLGG